MNWRTWSLLAVGGLCHGCGHALLDHASDDGGTIRVTGPYMAAMAAARLVGVEHCQGPVHLEEPGLESPRVGFRCLQTPEAGYPMLAHANPADGPRDAATRHQCRDQ